MNGTTNQRSDEEKVRRILQSLPKVPVREGFEDRLMERIAAGAAPPPRVKARPRLFPLRSGLAYAISTLAVVAVGVLAYHVLLRSGILPVERTFPQEEAVAPLILESGTDQSGVEVSEQTSVETRRDVGDRAEQHAPGPPPVISQPAQQRLSLPREADDVFPIFNGDVLRGGSLRPVGQSRSSSTEQRPKAAHEAFQLKTDSSVLLDSVLLDSVRIREELDPHGREEVK